MSTRAPDDLIAGLRAGQALTAHVVSEEDTPRIHGYSVHHDLALHYSFAESVLTTLRGTPPEREEGHAFAVALAFLMPVGAGEAPTHCAMLSNMLAAPVRSTVALAAACLVDQALAAELEWARGLDEAAAVSSADPAKISPRSDAAAVSALRAALGDCAAAIPELAGLEHALGPALLAVLRFCGLHQTWQVACAMVLARLPATCAEAQRHGPETLREYPMNLPSFAYEEEVHG